MENLKLEETAREPKKEVNNNKIANLEKEIQHLKTLNEKITKDFMEYCRVGIEGAKEDSTKVAKAIASILQAEESARTVQNTAQQLESMSTEAGVVAKKVATDAGGAEIAANKVAGAVKNV